MNIRIFHEKDAGKMECKTHISIIINNRNGEVYIELHSFLERLWVRYAKLGKVYPKIQVCEKRVHKIGSLSCCIIRIPLYALAIHLLFCMNSISPPTIPANFPKILLKRLELFFPDHFASILQGFSVKRIPSFRVNTLLSDVATVTRLGESFGFKFSPVAGIEGAFTLPKEDEYRFKGTALFRNGHVYMQSISSLLPVLALKPEKNTQVLDVCAAPGSKTTQLSALMENTGEIVAIEQSQIRMDKLLHNIRFQGAKNIRTEKMDAIKYLAESEDLFDAIVLDVPCSAEGRMSFDEERTYGYFSVKNIEEKAKIQSIMLQSSFERLKKGGKLVYSTCTLAPEENERVISRFLASNLTASILPIEFENLGVPHFYGIPTDGTETFHSDVNKAIRFYPTELTEGFFICLLQKN